MVNLSPTTPAAGYRPTYGVTYQNQLSPVTRPAAGYGPGGTLGGFGVPGQRPPAPTGAVAGTQGTQVPTMGGVPAPSLAPSAGPLTGTNALAGNPVQPGGYALTPGYSGVPMGLLGTGLSIASAAGVPGAGLLGMGLNGYNTYEYDDARRTQGLPGLSFGQWLGGILGLNGYGSGAPNALQSLGRATLPSGTQVVGNTEARTPNNAGFGTRTAGGPMQLNPGYSAPGFFGRMFGDSTGVGATDRTTGGDRMGRDVSQVAAGVGVGSGGIY
jgi:hypothetical protein